MLLKFNRYKIDKLIQLDNYKFYIFQDKLYDKSYSLLVNGYPIKFYLWFSDSMKIVLLQGGTKNVIKI